MSYNILLTSLCAPTGEEEINYFYGKNGFKNLYCDAMLTVEASCKYVLAKYPINEILTLGRKLTFDEGDDGRLIELREGKNFYTADIKELSTYSLFRYRIAQYIDELKIEQKDLADLLEPKEQEEVIRFIRDFYKKYGIQETEKKYNRFFDVLSKDDEMYDTFRAELGSSVPESRTDMPRYMAWIKYYLYNDFKETYKMEILPENESVQVRFIPTSVFEDGKLPVENILQLVNAISETDDPDINLYVALNSDDMTDNFVLMSVLNIVNMMPDNNVKLRNVFTTSYSRNQLAGEVRDDTEGYNITDLNSAFSTFLKYGKADMIIDYWEKCGVKNERIDQMIYAMRHIDAGVSLCEISEIENGIKQLRKLFENGIDFGGNDYYTNLFTILATGIQRDYGPLLEGEEIDFVDLARWAYEKEFYQQTLTLIESRAPDIFVDRGIFYYCENEEEKDNTITIIARYRNTLRPFETWKVDENIDHYFVKSYMRGDPAYRNKSNPQRAYAEFRVASLDNTDPNRITGHTLCSDRNALTDLLYAYYHIGEIRNVTNHAGESQDTRLIVEVNDFSARMSSIREAIEFFLQSYDKVHAAMPEEKPVIMKITPNEVKNRARDLQKDEPGGGYKDKKDDHHKDNRDNRDHKDYKDKKDNSNKKEAEPAPENQQPETDSSNKNEAEPAPENQQPEEAAN